MNEALPLRKLQLLRLNRKLSKTGTTLTSSVDRVLDDILKDRGVTSTSARNGSAPAVEYPTEAPARPAIPLLCSLQYSSDERSRALMMETVMNVLDSLGAGSGCEGESESEGGAEGEGVVGAAPQPLAADGDKEDSKQESCRRGSLAAAGFFAGTQDLEMLQKEALDNFGYWRRNLMAAVLQDAET